MRSPAVPFVVAAIVIAGCGRDGLPAPSLDGGDPDGPRAGDLRPRPPLDGEAPDTARPAADRPPPGRDMTAPDRPGPSSGLDPRRPITSLDDGELGRLCDWGVGLLGGYGTTMFCTDGTSIRNSPSRQSCIAGHDRSPRCLGTVADTEDCLSTLATLGCSQAIILGRPTCQLMGSCQRP